MGAAVSDKLREACTEDGGPQAGRWVPCPPGVPSLLCPGRPRGRQLTLQQSCVQAVGVQGASFLWARRFC